MLTLLALLKAQILLLGSNFLLGVGEGRDHQEIARKARGCVLSNASVPLLLAEGCTH